MQPLATDRGQVAQAIQALLDAAEERKARASEGFPGAISGLTDRL